MNLTNIKNYNYFKIRFFKIKIIYYFDLILFGLVIFYLSHNLMYVIFSFIDIFLESSWRDFIFNMSDANKVATHTTNLTIIHDDGGWSNSIRQIFIYGTGVFRVHLIRGGSPGSRGFIIGSSLVADGLSRVLANTINDPSYVLNNVKNWKQIWIDKDEGTVELTLDDETSKKITEAISSDNLNNNFISSNDIENLSNNIVNLLLDSFKGVLEPVTVSYSNELLLQQIHSISIILFLMSILIIVLFIGFILNVIVLFYSDRILNYFTNKYIRAYIIFNKKMMGLEIIFLGGSIIYFLYMLSYGLHFICTHPVILS